MKIAILGAGLAGSELALQCASKGCSVVLFEAKPDKKDSSVYATPLPGELVCSNSLKSENEGTPAFLLKEEMQMMHSFLLDIAHDTAVPAGRSLAVNRTHFSENILKMIRESSEIEYRENSLFTTLEEFKKSVDADYYVIATGPLTTETMANSIDEKHGYFYDAIAPQILDESIDYSKVFMASRYDTGDPDFLNIPLSKEEYDIFLQALLASEKLPYNENEKPQFFAQCMPIEELARRGERTLSFGPFRPVGFSVDGRRPYAVIQLRTENKEKTAWNLVGCQTRMRQAAQKEVFSMLPGLQHASFSRYGSVHRNSYFNATEVLDPWFVLKKDSQVRVIGQLSGVEGYSESIWSAVMLAQALTSEAELVAPPLQSMSGGMFRALFHRYDRFDPVHANYALISNPNKLKKKVRKLFYFESGKEHFKKWWLSL
ncbi:methylenetetrahydrofolate--tRNA-(uracil(54)-C(5))-methyltransferase (FADH(2)-oxidizing) TrmFO [bacterium]|nr:methylenetetrahydrofolate--tRNA-(uracil(54)-C(5))-methyltransferase (FADH(2)-oxidizing) TrmFO [bacterium]